MKRIKTGVVFFVIGCIVFLLEMAVSSFQIDNTFHMFNSYQYSGIVYDGRQFVKILPAHIVSQVWDCDTTDFTDRGKCENYYQFDSAKTWENSCGTVEVICLTQNSVGREYKEIMLASDKYPLDIFALQVSAKLIHESDSAKAFSIILNGTLENLVDCTHCYPVFPNDNKKNTGYIVMIQPVGMEMFSRKFPVYTDESGDNYYLRFEDDYYLSITDENLRVLF